MARDPHHIFEPNEQNTAQLRSAFGQFATGVAVVTCPSDNGPVAIAANSFTSVSLTPPMLLWAIGLASLRRPAFETSDHFAVHILHSEQKALCGQVAKDGFALNRIVHEINSHGVPLIADSLARFECAREHTHVAGDHLVIFGQIQRVSIIPGPGLGYFQGQYLEMSAP